MTERLVVIGGDAAGMSAASQARRRRTPTDLEIVAFERGRFTSYSACGIPYFVGDVVPEVDALIVRSPEEHRRRGIDVRLRTEVSAIDLDKRTLAVHDLESGTKYHEPFDQLVVATGAEPVLPALPGADVTGIHGVQVLDDGVAIRTEIDETNPRRGVVVGGGYIGLEMAEAMLQRGMDVTLVEGESHPMSTLDPDIASLVTEALIERGIKVMTDEKVAGFEDRDGNVAAVVTENSVIPADIVLLGLGVRPNVTLAESAGITIGASGGIAVNRRMQTEHEGVWAAGDCAEKFHRIAQAPVSIPLGTHANKEGRVAGTNIGGGYATFPGVVGTAVTKVCDLEIARTGLNETEATEAGTEWLTATVDSTTRAGYFPGAEPIKVKVVVEKRSGRLLGAQIVGREDAAKRIDVLSAALWNEMLVHEIQHLDLAYAPPFAPVWDPVLIAARKAADEVEETLAECR